MRRCVFLTAMYVISSCGMATLLPYRNQSPHIHSSVYLAETATVIGDVEIGSQSSIWFGAVIRGDVMPIRIGARTSVQDNCVVHATTGWAATMIGTDCTVGHSAILHGCTLEDRVLVGMGAIVLDAAHISSDTLIGAGTLVTAEAKFPPGVLLMGRPAKVHRPLRDDELALIALSAKRYIEYSSNYLADLKRD